MKLKRQLPLLLAIPLVLSGCSFKDFFSNIFHKDSDEPASEVTNYTVSFEANGGTGEMANMTTSGSTFVAPFCTFTYENHTFNKWALGKSSGTQYAVGETISDIFGDIMLFAIWTENSPTPGPVQTNYTVHFDANGGSGTMNDATTNGSSFTAPTCEFTKEGYTCTKWALGSSSGEQYTFGSEIGNISSDITLVAIWTENSPTPGPVDNFTVSFNLSGAPGSMESVSTTGSTFVVPDCTVTYDDHTFTGWALGSTTGTKYSAGDQITDIKSNIVLVAIWEENAPSTDEAAEYLTAFNSLKSAILTGHNYTNTIHSFLDGYQDDPECVVDDEFVMINDEIVYWNSNLLGGKTGIIKQKNQGYIYFDYYGNNVLYDSFYSTRTDVGISSIFDLTVENLFLGNAKQDSTNVSKFVIDNEDAIAVAANFTCFDVTFMLAPEEIYFTVSSDKTKLTLHSDFTYIHFDEVEKETHLISTFEIHNIGTTTEAMLESYVENPTNVFVAPTSWSEEDEAVFNSRYAGEVATFVEGLSYAYSVSEYLDKNDGKYKVHVYDPACGDLTASYAEVLEGEFFEEIESSRDSRLFKRVFIDNVNFSKTTYTVELAYKTGAEMEQEDLFPLGRFDILFHAKTENIDIATVGELNAYLSEKGYTSFVPQFNLPASTKVSNFKDETESKNAEIKYWEFTTGTQPLRIYIEDYADAVAAVEAYGATLESEPYGFIKDGSLTPFGEMRYENKTRYVEDSQVFIGLVSESSYKGYFEVRYSVHKEDDGVVTHHLVGLDIENPNTDFSVGDEFSFTGIIRAQYSDGNNAVVTSEAVFSEYDLSVGGDQQVKVTYEEGGITISRYYSIHVASNVNYVTEPFKYAGETITLTLNLCEDGTGTYTYNRVGTSASAGTFVQYFTYVIDGSTITFTLTQQYNTSEFTRFSLFMCEVPGEEGSTRVGTYTAAENKIEVETSNTSTDESHNNHTLRTFILQ